MLPMTTPSTIPVWVNRYLRVRFSESHPSQVALISELITRVEWRAWERLVTPPPPKPPEVCLNILVQTKWRLRPR